MKFIIVFFLFSNLALFCKAESVWAQFYQKADYGDMSTTRKNEVSGYNYYDKEGKMTGYSKKTYKGDYVYYNNEGNQLGSLQKEGNAYTFYNADGIAMGTMRKTPTGEYRYTDKFNGGLRSVTPPPGQDIGFLTPESFQKGTFPTQLEGTLKEKEQ